MVRSSNLRWVTKNSNDRTWTVVAIFLCPQGHRDSNGVRAAKPLARTALKSVLASSPHRPYPKLCTTRISPVGHQNKHGLHEEAVFVLRRRREIRTGFARRSRLRALPSKVLSPPFPHRPYPKLCTTRISPAGLFAHPAAIDLPAINAGDVDPAAARPGVHPPRERVPDDSGEPHYTRQSSALSSRLSKRRISLRRAGGGLDGRARGVVV